MSNEERVAQLERERLLHRYDAALDRGDMAAVSDVLARAEVDPRLAQMIIALNAAYADFSWSDAGEKALAPASFRRDVAPRSLQASTPDPARTWPGGWLSGALSFAVALLLLGLLAYVALLVSRQNETPVAALPSAEATPAPTESNPVAAAGSVTAPPTRPPTITPSPVAAVDAPPLRLTSPGPVAAFPGPEHYQGDRLTVVVELERYVTPREGPVSLRLSGGDRVEVTGRWAGRTLLVPLDTAGLTGRQTLFIAAAVEDVTVDETFTFEVLPAEERPAREAAATWQTRHLACCTLHYIAGSAAARDIEAIAANVQQAAGDFAELTGVPVEDVLDIYFVDRLWGTGGFSGTGEMIVSYHDRYYGPGEDMARLQVLARNGFSYVTDLNRPYFRYRLGLAIYLAGGHYRPESIPERAAAAGPLLFNDFQIELVALREAASVAYLVERFGWEAFWQYVEADSGDPVSSPDKTDAGMQQVFGISLDQFESDFARWLAAIEVTSEQQTAVDLSMRLHVLRRQYQEYVPAPDFLLGVAEETYARNAAIPSLLREPHAPVNVAVELMLANAQNAIIDGRFAEAEVLLTALDTSLQRGELTHYLAAEYGAIVRLLDDQGLEAVGLELDGDRATARVIREAPLVEAVALRKTDQVWEIIFP